MPPFSLRHLLYLLMLLCLVGALVIPPRLAPESIADCLRTEVEPNGRVQEAKRLTPLCEGVLVSGALPDGDGEDLYHLVLDQGSLLRLQLGTLPAEADYDLYLYNEDRELVAASRQAGGSAEQIELRLTRGTYYLRVYPYQGHSTQSYSLGWSRVDSP